MPGPSLPIRFLIGSRRQVLADFNVVVHAHVACTARMPNGVGAWCVCARRGTLMSIESGDGGGEWFLRRLKHPRIK